MLARRRRRAGEEALHRARTGVRVAQARRGLRARRSRSRRRPARPRRPKPACRSSVCGRSTTALLTAPEGFTFHKKLERGRERRKAMFNNPTERTVDWAAAEELAFATILADGIPDQADRRGRRARHVQPVATRSSTTRRTAAASFRCSRSTQAQRVVRNSQQPAQRERHRRLRVRLQHPGAVAPRHLGSAVRRLHQRRADHPRSVRDVGTRQVGTAAVARVPAPSRVRGTGPGALERETRAHSARPRRASTCGS